MVQLELRWQQADAFGHEEWDESNDVPRPTVRDNAFSIVREAGTFSAQGYVRGDEGGGVWNFSPNPNFSRELQQRGVTAPTEKEQFQLAMGDFKIGELDTLLASGFARPSAHDLVRMQEHGINNDYIAAMKGLRYTPKTIDELIRLRDHGVTAEYIADLQRFGYTPGAEDLVTLRDHGVSAEFIEGMRSHGYSHVSTGDLIRLRDHGVSTRYVANLQSFGYTPSVEDLVRLVDHGVSTSFIERMRSHGYTHLTADELIRLADHGF
jgi:hypothetical protein